MPKNEDSTEYQRSTMGECKARYNQDLILISFLHVQPAILFKARKNIFLKSVFIFLF